MVQPIARGLKRVLQGSISSADACRMDDKHESYPPEMRSGGSRWLGSAPDGRANESHCGGNVRESENEWCDRSRDDGEDEEEYGRLHGSASASESAVTPIRGPVGRFGHHRGRGLVSRDERLLGLQECVS